MEHFLGVEQKYFNGGSVQLCIVISEFLEDVESTSDEKKAPLYMEQLQKEHCMLYLFGSVYSLSLFTLLVTEFLPFPAGQ